jgi:DNA anti-recombination protein RmuC
MEIASIIISSLALVAVIVLILLTVKRNKVQQPPVEVDLKEIGAIQKQLDLLAPQLKGDIELAVTKEMAKLGTQTVSLNETNNQKLERFQNGITESLAKRFDALNKQIDDKLIEINKKVDEKLAEGFKGTTETMAQVR